MVFCVAIAVTCVSVCTCLVGRLHFNGCSSPIGLCFDWKRWVSVFRRKSESDLFASPRRAFPKRGSAVYLSQFESCLYWYTIRVEIDPLNNLQDSSGWSLHSFTSRLLTRISVFCIVGGFSQRFSALEFSASLNWIAFRSTYESGLVGRLDFVGFGLIDVIFLCAYSSLFDWFTVRNWTSGIRFESSTGTTLGVSFAWARRRG